MAEITQADLIARIQRRLPPHGLAEIEGLSGEELLQIFAAILERAGRVRRQKMRARLLRDATGATKAATTVTVHFDEATGPDGYEVAVGQALFQTRWGVRFVLSGQGLARAADEANATQVVAVEAEWAGWDGNVRAREIRDWAIPDLNNRDSISWDGGTDAGKDEFLARVAAGTIWFEADADATGGQAGTLDIRARGRGLPRAEDELDATLRKRLRIVPDAVSPQGIIRAVDKALGAEGATWISEFWEWAFAWGISGWGLHAWGRKRMFIVFVPAGSDIVAVQALVDRIKGAGYYGLVLEEA